MARRANSLATLLRQVDELAPKRNRQTDGWIGDRKHRQRKSDHNPNSKGIVQAQDFTHDPGSGADMHMISDRIKNDPRVKYLIWNGRIWQYGRWHPYSGSNQHTTHLHVSVNDNPRFYDDSSLWNIFVEGDDVTEAEMNQILGHIDAAVHRASLATTQRVTDWIAKNGLPARTKEDIANRVISALRKELNE